MPFRDARSGLLSSQSDELATKEEAALLLDLRRELKDDLAAVPQFPELVGDLRLLRSLRAFDHDIPEVAEAFRQHLEVRRRHGLDRVREAVAEAWAGRLWELRYEELPHGELLCSYMPEVLIYAASKRGDPVSLGLWGRGRPGDFIREVPRWQEYFLEYYLHAAEARALLLDEASRAQGRLVHFTWVFDLQDWSLIGNSDRTWTKFCMEVTGPVGTSYHDINAYFYAIRTNQMAKIAYGMIKPLLPRKVTEKVFLLGSDLRSSRELRATLDDQALAALEEGGAEAKPRRREGQALLKPAGSFALRVEVPPGGSLRWRFGLERGRSCFARLVHPGSVRFSVARWRGGAATKLAYFPAFEPRMFEAAAGAEGSLRLPEGAFGAADRSLELRWENGGTVFFPQRLRYEVEVECPPAMAKAVEAPSRLSNPLVALILSLCALAIAVALRRA